MENYPSRPPAPESFDVSRRHYQPSLAISGAGYRVSDGYFPGTSGYNVPVTPFVSKWSSYVTLFSYSKLSLIFAGWHYLEKMNFFNLQANRHSPPPSKYSYLINPDLNTKFMTKVWHDVNEKFLSADELKHKLTSSFEEKLPPFSELECGYLEKRNGKRWIENDKDLEAMYKVFDENDEITLWCEGLGDETHKRSGKKRKSEEDEHSDNPASKRMFKETQIDKVVQELREIHSGKWSLPQYRLWARMNVNGQHDDLDVPPQIPLFSGGLKTPPKDEIL